MQLTTKQRHALRLIAALNEEAVSNVDGPTLAAHLGTTPQGAHMTAASLVKRGLLVRAVVYGQVRYRVSERGWEEVQYG